MTPNGYARTYRTNSILTASPGQLVLMLFDGAINSLGIALQAFEQPEGEMSRILTINNSLIKAQNILAELQGSLNVEAGGEFAKTMFRLYDYHIRRLNEANMKKSQEPIVEVQRLLLEIRNSWAEMLCKSGAVVEGSANVA